MARDQEILAKVGPKEGQDCVDIYFCFACICVSVGNDAYNCRGVVSEPFYVCLSATRALKSNPEDYYVTIQKIGILIVQFLCCCPSWLCRFSVRCWGTKRDV